MPSSCWLFTFKSIWLFALILLVLCMSRNTQCSSRPLSHLHQEGTWEKRCCFCFTRVLWALACTYANWLFYFLLKTYFIDLFIMPSFYLGWTGKPCLDSLLYGNSAAAAGQLWFLVLILQEHKDSLTELTQCPRQTRDASPNINLNAINSASGRRKPTGTICFVHLISTYPDC